MCCAVSIRILGGTLARAIVSLSLFSKADYVRVYKRTSTYVIRAVRSDIASLYTPASRSVVSIRAFASKSRNTGGKKRTNFANVPDVVLVKIVTLICNQDCGRETRTLWQTNNTDLPD